MDTIIPQSPIYSITALHGRTHKYSAKEVKFISVGSTDIRPSPIDKPRISGRTRYILIEPANAPTWVAKFKEGRPTELCVSGLFTCPDPQHICVIINGRVYIVDVDSQLEVKSRQFYVSGIYQVEVSTKHSLLLFCCDSGVWAWGRDGLAWDHADIAHADSQLREVSEDFIKGIAIRSMDPIAFNIDIATGEYRCRPLAVESFDKDPVTRKYKWRIKADNPNEQDWDLEL